jgi:hypothetical protein
MPLQAGWTGTAAAAAGCAPTASLRVVSLARVVSLTGPCCSCSSQAKAAFSS